MEFGKIDWKKENFRKKALLKVINKINKQKINLQKSEKLIKIDRKKTKNKKKSIGKF